MSTKNKPYHSGEVHLQEIHGVSERMQTIGEKILRTYIIEQHRSFFEELPYAFISVLDSQNKPWAFMLEGNPGFIQVIEQDTVRIHHKFDFPIPGLALNTGDFFACVGLDYNSRRRNLFNGYIVACTENSIDIRIKQSYGNCPKYIQTRRRTPLKELDQSERSERTSEFTLFTDDIQKAITNSDTFYLASAHPQPDKHIQNQGIDINHRGGKPGFVQFENKTQLWFQNYPGNNMFYSFGNIESNPRVGLLFIDFDSQELYHLTGTAVIEKKGKDFHCIFKLDCGYVEKNALQSSWEFLEYSPALESI